MDEMTFGLDQLEKQCWAEIAKLGTGTVKYDDWRKKFAELVMRECIRACYDAQHIRNIVPPTQEQVILWCVEMIENRIKELK